MEKKTYQMNGYKLHIIKTDKFKEVSIKFIFKKPIAKSEITIRNMVFSFLGYSSKKYPTNRKAVIKSIDLYNQSILSNTIQHGKLIISTLTTRFINEKYTEPDMLPKNIDFFLGNIFKPNFINKEAEPKTFNIVKEGLINTLKSKLENKSYQAISKALINTQEDIVNYEISGYLENISDITPQSIYEYYQTIFNDEIDVYVVGDININTIKTIFTQKVNIKNKTVHYDDYIYYPKLFKEHPTTEITEEKILQSHLVIIYKLKDLTDFERYFVGPIFNSILGRGGMTSKLFSKIREEQSLCYSIVSTYTVEDNLLVIYAGIDAKNFNQAKESIIDIFNNIKAGSVTSKELTNAKISYLANLRLDDDNLGTIIGNNYMDNLMKLPSKPTKIRNINNITQQDVIDFSNKLVIDNIYLLKGVNHEKV